MKMTKIKRLLYILAISLAAVSCASLKKTTYFQGIDQAEFVSKLGEFEARIAPNDNLYITVTSTNPQAVEMFNPVRLDANLQTLSVQGYLVDKDGNINFPVLGQVHLGGMTKTEAVALLREKISTYVVNPIVNIRFLNYKVTVLGEVNRPGTYTINDEKISLLEALGLAGDLTIYGKRDNILVFRNINGENHFERIDMTSAQIFNSPFFYLQQNDIVYVQPNRAKAGTANYNQYLPMGLSVLSLIATIVSIAL